MAVPADDGFFMPAEWAPHQRTWMSWPCREETWGGEIEAAREAYAEVAKTISAFEPVTMVVNPEELATASLALGSGVACVPIPHSDSWLRDSGPTFVVDRKGALAGIDWRFNAWGEKYQDYAADAAVAAALLDHLKVPRYDAPFVLEGGSIHVDGEGTALTSEECLLNANRNPELSREEIEENLRRYLGVKTVIWLGRGLQDDETDGHVDNLACFVKPGVVMALSSEGTEDPNTAILKENLERLKTATDAQGRTLQVIEVAQPKKQLAANGARLALSYINFYVCNGGVIVPSFDDSNDQKAFDLIAAAFPDRKTLAVPALDILAGGGGIHCITQQQPG